MFHNQYIAVSASCATSPSLGMSAVDFNGLRIHTHPPLNVSIATHRSTELALLGYVIDPLHPEQTNVDILRTLADGCDTINDLFEELHILSGRYVILYKNGSSFIATGDPCHLRQIYFGFAEDRVVLTSSPRLFLTYFNFTLQMSKEKQDFIKLSAYTDQEGAWYGDASMDDRLHKLLPNHYLDIPGKEIKRIPCVPAQDYSREEHIIDSAAAILTGTYSSLSRRYQLIQPLTAGWDSRVLLSASKNIRDNIRYYVFAPSSGKPADVWVPGNLSQRLQLDFTVVTPDALRDDFLSQYEKEHIIPRILPKTAQIQYHYDRHYGGDIINVNGNGAEIARCFYGYTNRRISLDMLLVFSGYGRKARFVREELEKWYSAARPYAADSGIPLLDLFYWEQRMGNWGSLFPFEQDIAVEEISPFNNRSLLCSLLRVKPERRRSPHYLFFRKLIRHLWTDALSEPLNPDAGYLKGTVKGNSMMRYLVLKFGQRVN